MPVTSAGMLPYRLPRGDAQPEILIAHMGGPYWAAKDEGAWSIVKGEYDDEDALDAAKREFREELGVDPPEGEYAELGIFPYSSGKRVAVFVIDGSAFEVTDPVFGEFELEWPPRSGTRQSFPEVDRVEWVPLDRARELLVKGQRPAIDKLAELLESL